MHQFARLARCRHKVIPAPRDMHFRIEIQDAICQWIAMVMIVKQPAVKAGVEESSLNCSKIHAADCTPPRCSRAAQMLLAG